MALLNIGGESKSGIFNIKFDKSFFDGIAKMPHSLKLFLILSVIAGFVYFNFSHQIYQRELIEVQSIQKEILSTTKTIENLNVNNTNQSIVINLLVGEIGLQKAIIKEVIYSNDKKFSLILDYLDLSNQNERDFNNLKKQIELTNEYYHKIIDEHLKIDNSEIYDSIKKEIK